MNYDQLFDTDFKYFMTTKDIEAVKEYLKKKQGWIYIAYSRDNNFLKIGRTGKNPMVRAKTLSSTGVLSGYEILFSLKVFNQFMVEKKVHNKLKNYRIKKEFFSVDKNHAIAVIEKSCAEEDVALARFFDLDMIREDLNLIEYALI